MSTKAKRRPRTTPWQAGILETWFKQKPAPNKSDVKEIASKVGIKPKSIHFWFQNRRAKEKRMQRSEGNKITNTSNKPMHVDQQPTTSLSIYPMQQPSIRPPAPSNQQQQQQQQRFYHYQEGPHQVHQRLPSLSSILQQTVSLPMTRSDTVPHGNRPGYAQAPMIPFFFHHAEFGIESCMIQWSQQRDDL
ncbi:hypothetical protein DFQ28_005036 [Apophysomyces sp. BC1034]|nr:hypothetical protein DFQ29_000471 [Apophysomyces sp. BC1021]KAG0194823.1 hypothetical protein DFQ28_005036 [Apophysomyces sp. BC1034]